MNQVVKLREALPVPSQDLGRALYLAESDDGLRYGVAPAVVEEAKRHLAAMRSEPATAQQIAEWLRVVAASVRNPPSGRGEVTLRAAAIAAACADLPAALFSVEAQRLGLQKWEFWPAAADVRAVLVEAGNEFLARRRALAAVARAKVQTPAEETGERQAPNDDEKRRVSQMVAQLRAEVEEREAAEKIGSRRGKAAPVPPRILLEQYQALADQGNKAAAYRLAMLEKWANG